MQAISDLIGQFGVWLWFAVAVALLALETVVPGIHFLWFGLAAAIVGMIALMVPLAWQWQMISFAVIAVATIFLVRRSSRMDIAKTDEPMLNVRGAQYIGRKLAVAEAIVNGRGKVQVGDTQWLAEGEDAPVGASVIVSGVNGTALVVHNGD